MGAEMILQAVSPSAATRSARGQSCAVDGDAFGRASGGHDREIGQRRVEHHRGGAVVEHRARVPGEIGGDHRSEERGVGRDPAQLPGHDRHVDAGSQRRALTFTGAPEVEPTGARAGRGQTGLPVAVVEVDDRARAEVGHHRRGRGAELDLFG